MAQLSEEHRQAFRDALRALNTATRSLKRTAESARQAGELSEASSNHILLLAGAIAGEPLTQLTMGMLVDFRDSSPEVGKPVADSELPDINLVTLDVPNN